MHASSSFAKEVNLSTRNASIEFGKAMPSTAAALAAVDALPVHDFDTMDDMVVDSMNCKTVSIEKKEDFVAQFLVALVSIFN